MKLLAAALFFCFSTLAFGQAAEVANADPRVEERLRVLAEELRCLVCQNQTIADSNAPLALDLRNQIRSQIAQGRSDAQIRDYMVERYGDFVLYRPPLRPSTALLWGGPFVLLAVGIVVFLRVTRRQGARARAPASDADAARIAALLEDDGHERNS
jgi:cytochrome c-type biogenesis protein CcmH